MSRRFLVAALAGLAVSVVGVSAAEARYDFRVSPRVGKPTTAFVVSFRAPYAADGRNTEYFLEAIGPPSCAQIFDFSGRALLGQREAIRLTSGDDVVLPRSRRRWCRGSYVGVVTWQDSSSNADNKYIGYVKFRVR